MNGQTSSLLAYKLKKLMAAAEGGAEVSENVRQLLEADRNLRAERFELLGSQLRVIDNAGSHP